jgi:hypothetical protein
MMRIFNALKEAVNDPGTLEVGTANSVVLGGQDMPFMYQGVDEIAKDLSSKGYEVNKDSLIPTIFLGYTQGGEETKSGNARVILSDGKGAAASAPQVEHAVTAAHEIFGHGLANMKGMPWKHDRGPVDSKILQIEDRTRRLHEKKR